MVLKYYTPVEMQLNVTFNFEPVQSSERPRYTETMKNIKKSFATPSNKPVDVQYRLKRAAETTQQAEMFIRAIDSAALPEGTHAAVLEALRVVEAAVAAAAAGAPQKKARGKAAAKETPAEEAVAVKKPRKSSPAIETQIQAVA